MTREAHLRMLEQALGTLKHFWAVQPQESCEKMSVFTYYVEDICVEAMD